MRTAGAAVIGFMLGACAVETVPDLHAEVHPIAPVEQITCNGSVSKPHGPCACQADCEAPAFCVSERESHYPGGYCHHICDPTDASVPGFRCELGLLVPTCDGPTRPCRPGYSCVLDPVEQVTTCGPHCISDAQCPSTGHCDLYTGLCQPERDGGGLMAPCARGDECKSAFCYETPPGGPTPRFCASFCDIADRYACPEGGLCIRLGRLDAGATTGLCLELCDAGTCRAGFTCDNNILCLPLFRL